MKNGRQKKIFRFAPCPPYDVAGMENWLSDLAEDGLFLKADGFTADIAEFEERTPQKIRYRLEAVQRSGDWAPDPEQLEIGKRYSWEYVAKRKDFFIFRSAEPVERELNTDPEVQALALNAVKKKQREAMIWALFFLLIYPFLITKGCLVLTALAVGTPLALACILFGIWEVAERIHAYCSLKKLQSELRSVGCGSGEGNWKKSRIGYRIKRTASAAAWVILILAVFSVWMSHVEQQKTPIEEYGKQLPFAVISDFAGEGSTDYRYTMEGFLEGSIDVIAEKSDWLAPCWLEYNEHARVTKADGSMINGGLYVDYFEFHGEAPARLAAKELYRYEKIRYFQKTEKLAPLDLEADTVICYSGILHAPTVIIQKGNKVIRAYFYQTSSAYQIPFAEWAQIMFDSVWK